jgi:hypothetical protein
MELIRWCSYGRWLEIHLFCSFHVNIGLVLPGEIAIGFVGRHSDRGAAVETLLAE